MKLIISRYINQGKNYLYNSIKQDLDNQKIVYLVVPEQFTLGKELESFDTLNLESTINFKVKSFRTIIDEVLHINGGRALNFVSEQTKFIMMQKILLDLQSELRVFHKNIYDKSFIEMLIEFIDELSSNEIDIDYLEKIISKEETTKELKAKLLDIVVILNNYNDMKLESNFTMIDRTRLAINNIKNTEEFKNISFYFDRFNDMSAQEIEIIKEIDKMTQNLVINLILDRRLIDKNTYKEIDDADIFDISMDFYRKLIRSINNYELIELGDYSFINEIEELTDNIFSYNLQKIKKRYESKKLNSIYISRSDNTNDEIENLVVSIKKDIIDKKYNYSDIAILTTNASEYYNKIRTTFDLNDLPFFLDETRNLLENPMIKYLSSGIELLNGGLRPILISQFLKSNFVNYNSLDLNLFSSYMDRKNIYGNMIFDDKYFTVHDKIIRYKEEDEEDLIKVLDIRNKFLEIIGFDANHNIINELEFDSTIKDYVNIVYKFFSNEILLNPFIDNELDFDEEKYEENKLIWDNFIETLDDLYNISNDELISFERFSEILHSAIDNFKIGIIPPSQDSVIVGEIKRSRFNKVKKLYVIGMSNLYYPIPNKINDILLEDEKLELIENDIPIRNISENINANDLISFYTMLNTPTEEIVFSYSLIDSANADMLRASIIDWVIAMIPGENISASKEDYKDVVYSSTLIAKYLPEKLLQIRDNKKLDQGEKSFVKGLLNSINNSPEKYSNIAEAVKYTTKDYRRKNISPDLIEKIYNTERFSVSQLESYNSNPYGHFIRYGIKPREYESFDISKLDTGNLMHDVLSKYVQDQYENIEVNIDEIYDDATNELFELYKLEDDKNRFFLNQMKEDTKSYAYVINKQNNKSEISKMYFEQRYGENSLFPAINLNINNRKILIEGKIDRIDEYDIDGKKYFRIVDYKTGSKTFDIEKVYYGIDLQLLLYLRSTLMKYANSAPIGAFYQSLNNQLSYKLILQKEREDEFIIPQDMRLTGLINNNPYLYSIIDSETDQNKVSDSEIYRFFGRGRKLSNKDNSVDEDVFYKLFEHNERLIIKTIENILNGDIQLRPYVLNGNSPYTYNPYKTIDKGEDLRFEYLDRLNWDYVLDKLYEGNKK